VSDIDQMTETDTPAPEAKSGLPAITRYVNANHKLVVYMTLAFRMRDGAAPDRIARTIARMTSQVPAEGKDIAAFASLLSERLAEALKRPDAVDPPFDDDAPGLVLDVAQQVFGHESVSFVEQISLDVPTAEMLSAAVRSGDAERTMNRIAADILRNTAEVLRTSIEPRK
jgi:hypothetical protein